MAIKEYDTTNEDKQESNDNQYEATIKETQNLERKDEEHGIEKQKTINDMDLQMTEFRNRMNEVINKLKKDISDLAEENEVLQ